MKFRYDEIIVGSSLHALLYAYIYRIPVFFTKAQKPFAFEYFDSAVSFPSIGISQNPKKLKSPDGFQEVGISKLIVWERLFFLLSIEGLLPLSKGCHQIRDDGERLVCTDEYSKLYECTFNTCYYFGDSDRCNLAEASKFEICSYICYDYIAFHKGGKHEFDYVSTDSDFVGEIWFYSSPRIDGNTGVKDGCVVSRLTKEQIWDPNYSETMARFKMEKVIEEKGMRGPLNGYDHKGRPKHYRFKTSHQRRVVVPIRQADSIKSIHVKDPPIPLQSLVKRLQEHQAICDYILPA